MQLLAGDEVLSVNGDAPQRCIEAVVAPLGMPSGEPAVLRIRRPAPPIVTLPAVIVDGPEASGVQVPGSTPTFGGSFGGYGLAPGEFSMPCNVLILPDGDVVVADSGGCRVQVMSPDGELRRILASSGEEPGQLNFPAGLAVADDSLYVADRGNCRVQRLRLSDGTPLACSDGAPHAAAGDDAGGAEELLNYPWGVALHCGCVYVSDMRGRLCVLDACHLTLRGSFACLGSGQLVSPHAMAIVNDELYVVEHDCHCVRVMALASVAAAEESIGTTTPFFTGHERVIGRQGGAAGEFQHPVGVAVHEHMLLVSEFTGRRVQALTLVGEPLFVLASPSGTRLLGLGVGASRIFVGDFDGDCVHWWTRPGADDLQKTSMPCFEPRREGEES